MRPRGIALALVTLGAAGCAKMTPGLGFEDVETTVNERAGVRVHWNNGTEEDAEVAAAVAGMLEREIGAEQAVQIALLNNRNLQAVYEELSIAQADLVQAGLLRNPLLSGNVRFGPPGVGADVEVAQDFVSLLSMPLRKGRAAAAFEEAKARVSAAVLDAAFETRSAFYEYQAAEQLRGMRATVVEATGASYELARRLRQAGNNRDLDVSIERALHEQSKVDLAGAEAGVVRLRERMNALMGLWGAQTAWRAAARLPDLPEQERPETHAERAAVAASLELEILRREVEVAARSVGIAEPFGWLTDAEVGVAAEREPGEDWTIGPSLALPIPLFDQGQGAVGAAKARLRQASERYIARAVEVRSRARAAESGVQSAWDRARYYQRIILPLRQQIVEETQQQYNAMQVSAFQLLGARRDQIDAGAEYVESLRDYWLARAVMDQILMGRMSPFEASSVMSGSESVSPESSGGGGH
jgi:cobalt-zinc-cadmium efflux system outer membrane protein